MQRENFPKKIYKNNNNTTGHYNRFHFESIRNVRSLA